MTTYTVDEPETKRGREARMSKRGKERKEVNKKRIPSKATIEELICD